MKRELSPFKLVKDVGRKLIITRDLNASYRTVSDVEIVPILDFLLAPDNF